MVKDGVTSMMGIKEVVAAGAEVRIAYGRIEATSQQIEKALVQAGAHLGGGWAERVRYSEDCEAANTEVSERDFHGH